MLKYEHVQILNLRVTRKSLKRSVLSCRLSLVLDCTTWIKILIEQPIKRPQIMRWRNIKLEECSLVLQILTYC